MKYKASWLTDWRCQGRSIWMLLRDTLSCCKTVDIMGKYWEQLHIQMRLICLVSKSMTFFVKRITVLASYLCQAMLNTLLEPDEQQVQPMLSITGSSDYGPTKQLSRKCFMIVTITSSQFVYSIRWERSVASYAKLYSHHWRISHRFTYQWEPQK